MKTLTKWILAALAPVAMVGCDPFEEAVTGPPVVISTGFTDTTGPTPYLGTAAGSAWTIPGIASTCAAGQASVEGFIWVKFNKLLEGGSIQTSPTDCTPAAALGLAVTPAPPAGGAWYACYSPQSPSPDEGASVMIFLAPAATPPGGWAAASPIPASGTAATSVHATGTAHDKDGAAVSFDVTAQIAAEPGVPGTPTFTAITNTSLTVTWTQPCVAVTSYDLQRAPDVAGAPGTWATITNTAGLTFGDTGLSTVTTYWYRVIANVTAGGTLTSGEASVTTAPAAPAAPTFASVTATSLTVNWAAATGAATYTVQRAPDVSGAPGTWADVPGGVGLTGLTFSNTGLTTATTYWYRIVAVNPASSASANGAAASVTTL